jgi:hypothetical protein
MLGKGHNWILVNSQQISWEMSSMKYHMKKKKGKTRTKANITHEKKGGDAKLSLSSFFKNQIHTQGHLFKL